MQEVNLKFYNFPLILLTFLFRARDVCTGHFSFKICGVVLWRAGVRNIILLHTHIILSQHFTNKFSLHTTFYSHATPSWTEKDLHLFSFVSVYQHALSFAVCFSRWGIENFYIVFPYSLKERVKQRYFSCCQKCKKCFWGRGVLRCDPTRVMASTFLKFLDHTQRCTTVGSTPLDEWSARRRDLYLTIRNTHNKHPCPR
jgi:hypothetical protein